MIGQGHGVLEAAGWALGFRLHYHVGPHPPDRLTGLASSNLLLLFTSPRGPSPLSSAPAPAIETWQSPVRSTLVLRPLYNFS
jgi:hypothetical protein